MTGRMAYQLYRLFWTGLDWLYPPTCGGCDRRGERWCENCQNSIDMIRPPLCPRCGQNQPEEMYCNRCLHTPPNYQALRSWATFGGNIRNALHRLKYRKDVSLGEALSQPLYNYFMRLNWSIDMIIPVPLGAARLVERGYNQAELLARPLALACGVSIRSNALWRAKETRSQVGLSAVSRRLNVADAFLAKPALVNGKKILIVDDVTTTGATLDSCAAALLAAGAQTVFGLTLARAVLSSTDNSA